MGPEGIKTLQKTTNYIPDNIFKIADAKRGDIGNTSIMYAKTFFETLDFDAVTLSPYMGKDSVNPYLEYKNKWAIILALTSNKSAIRTLLLEAIVNTTPIDVFCIPITYETVPIQLINAAIEKNK